MESELVQAWPRVTLGQPGAPSRIALRRPLVDARLTRAVGKECLLLENLPAWVCSVTQLSPTLCDPMNSSPPGSFVHGTLQTRVLERVAISFLVRCFHLCDLSLHSMFKVGNISSILLMRNWKLR